MDIDRAVEFDLDSDIAVLSSFAEAALGIAADFGVAADFDIDSDSAAAEVVAGCHKSVDQIRF